MKDLQISTNFLSTIARCMQNKFSNRVTLQKNVNFVTDMIGCEKILKINTFSLFVLIFVVNRMRYDNLNENTLPKTLDNPHLKSKYSFWKRS